MKQILLIDLFAQIYRAFYGVKFLTPANEEKPSNAIFSMTRFLLKIQNLFPNMEGAFVSDLGKPEHRLEIAADYKANRPHMPEEMRMQVPVIFELISAFGWQIHQQESWEADDLISAFVHFFPDFNFKIISSDKDLAQLVNKNISLLVPRHDGNGFEVRDINAVKIKYGVYPEQIIDYLALIGDSSDNIPGINGIGPKTAVKLLEQFGSIENMLKNSSDIDNSKYREKIVNGEKRLKDNVALIKLLSQPPANSCWSENLFLRNKTDYSKVKEILEEYRLQSILREIDHILSVKNDSSSDLFSYVEQENDKCGSNHGKDPVYTENPKKTKPLFQPDLF